MLYNQTALEALVQTDEQLLQQMADDNQTAFTSLYRRYWEGLFITACKVLGGKEEAADVIQDVFLSLWSRRHELDLQGSLAAYLHTGVRYKCIHYIQKNSTRRGHLFLLAEIKEKNNPIDAESTLGVKEIQTTISRTVSEMPPKMQEVYKLSREEHLSHEEIAGYMNISVQTVKKHIQHALQIIRKSLGNRRFILAVIVVFFMG